MSGFKSEILKYKRTLIKKLIVFIPVFFAVYALAVQATMMNNPLSHTQSWSWESLLGLVFNWWSFLFLPIGFALFATLVAIQEKKAGNYRVLRMQNKSIMKIWFYKELGMAFYSLMSHIVLVVVIIIVGVVSGNGKIPFFEISVASLVCWFTSLTLIPIQLWAATWKGMPFSMGIGFIGMIIGVLSAPKSFWIIVPWSWATRLMCPLIGVHPNGAFLTKEDLLMDSSVIPVGIFVSLVFFIVVTVLTAKWFERREIQ